MGQCMEKFLIFISTRKFYIKRNSHKVDSIETGSILIAHLLIEVHVHYAFLINDDKILSSLLNL